MMNVFDFSKSNLDISGKALLGSTISVLKEVRSSIKLYGVKSGYYQYERLTESGWNSIYKWSMLFDGKPCNDVEENLKRSEIMKQLERYFIWQNIKVNIELDEKGYLNVFFYEKHEVEEEEEKPVIDVFTTIHVRIDSIIRDPDKLNNCNIGKTFIAGEWREQYLIYFEIPGHDDFDKELINKLYHYYLSSDSRWSEVKVEIKEDRSGYVCLYSPISPDYSETACAPMLTEGVMMTAPNKKLVNLISALNTTEISYYHHLVRLLHGHIVLNGVRSNFNLRVNVPLKVNDRLIDPSLVFDAVRLCVSEYCNISILLRDGDNRTTLISIQFNEIEAAASTKEAEVTEDKPIEIPYIGTTMALIGQLKTLDDQVTSSILHTTISEKIDELVEAELKRSFDVSVEKN
jgi:hypothetical protein